MKFRMVDRILDWQSQRSITGIKTVSFEEYSIKSAFGGNAFLPESLLMESLFQLGNWLIMLSSDFEQMGLLVRVEKVTFREPLRPGQQLSMEVNAVSYRRDGISFNGKAFVGDREIAEGKGCLATPVALTDFHNPADLKVLFSEIYRPPEKGLK
jgi:3-hydroxyacyl-[acyl-carrier-protein] dehydratase